MIHELSIEVDCNFEELESILNKLHLSYILKEYKEDNSYYKIKDQDNILFFEDNETSYLKGTKFKDLYKVLLTESNLKFYLFEKEFTNIQEDYDITIFSHIGGKMSKKSIYEVLKQKFKNKKIDRIILEDGYIEYRIWTLASEAKYGKVVSVGRKCLTKFLVDPDDMEILDNNSRFIKDSRAENYTIDFDFYKNITGVDPTPFIGLDSEKFYEEMNKLI